MKNVNTMNAEVFLKLWVKENDGCLSEEEQNTLNRIRRNLALNGLDVSGTADIIEQAAVLDYWNLIEEYLKETVLVQREKRSPENRASKKRKSRYERTGRLLNKAGASDHPKRLEYVMSQIRKNRKNARRAAWQAGQSPKNLSKAATLAEEEKILHLYDEAKEKGIRNQKKADRYVDKRMKTAS